MNQTKLSILVAFIAFISMFSNQVTAQEKPVALGIKGGLNLSTFGGNLKDTKSVLRYQFGITAEIALPDHMYILTGLDFQTKGSRYNTTSDSGIKYNPMYLQVPVNIGYKYDLGKNIRLTGSAGPYIAYGIGGKAKTVEGKESVFGKNKFKRFDYGLTAGAGVEFGKIAVVAGYEYGLANINDSNGRKIKNRNPYLTVGYSF